MGENITFAVAILAGLFSFLSPCVLPLVPAYIGYLSGATVTAEGVAISGRRDTFLHALGFVLGFSLIFVLLGVTAWSIGDLLYTYLPWLARIGGIVLIVFGLALMGVFKLPFLYTQKRVEVKVNPSLGYLSSFIIGIFFGAGWTPCVGPILGGILLLASQASTATHGALLLVAYSLGLGIPFLIVGAAFEAASETIHRLNRRSNWVSIASGVILVLLGVAVLTNQLQLLARYGPFIDLESWLLK
ncbi:MAG: cytochrome c biogenesis protein CcdA [Chloroflexi bacterium]|nr:MAG: cytochrome c biogenesis protein CcdA [Chloroflexota bacterium]